MSARFKVLLHEDTVEQPNRMTVKLRIPRFIIVTRITAIRYPYFIHNTIKVLQGHFLTRLSKQAFQRFSLID